jgi:hypothetical protein
MIIAKTKNLLLPIKNTNHKLLIINKITILQTTNKSIKRQNPKALHQLRFYLIRLLYQILRHSYF